MGYSGLVTKTRFVSSKCHRGKRTHKIDSVAIHHWAGPGSVGSGFISNWESRGVCANYGIETDGTIVAFTDESIWSKCTSSPGCDNRSITIEVANSKTGDPWPVSSASYESLLKLLVDVCQRNNIDSLRWANDKTYAINAANGGPVTKQNMFIHKWFKNKVCPGPYLESRMGDIAKAVNTALKSQGQSGIASAIAAAVESVGEVTETIEESAEEIVQARKPEVDYKELTPYILTLDRNSPIKIDYKKMSDIGVRGVILEAGYQFDTSHNVQSVFRNPRLYEQLEVVQKAKLDYGYYMQARAWSIKDVEEEMYQLSFIVRKYPPTLGMWLKLNFKEGSKPKTNDILVEKYYEELVRLGLTDKVGFYVTRKQLAKITWDDFQEKWYLWIVDHVNNVSEIDTLLDPEFFDIDGKSGDIPNLGGGLLPGGSSSGSSDGEVGSGDGVSVVNEALKYVGNKYVWGGTSLTNGCDCSGFTMQIYKKFGVNLPHSSSGQRSHGKAVNASDIKPGDLVCYDGHVAIFTGRGPKKKGIVHASNSSPYPKGGIKESDTYDYRHVVTIRRLVSQEGSSSSSNISTSAPKKLTKVESKYTPKEFKRAGVLHWGGWKWTWYSQRVLPGGGLKIPGRHVDKKTGYVCDSSGCIVVACNKLSKGTVIGSPLGKKCKVYDRIANNNDYHIDVYVDW